MTDQQLVEVLLGLVRNAREASVGTRLLFQRFGSLSDALSAPREALAEAGELGREEIAILRLVRECALRLGQGELADRPVLSNWTALLRYLQMAQGRAREEEVRVLFLDSRNHLLADELQGRGTVNHAPLYPREVIRRALELRATALLLVHNHPSGHPEPSEADLVATAELIAAARPFGITLHDHIIVGAGRHFSMRTRGMM